jgi:hypoxanthine phosphoribosyltransferase
MLDGIEEVLLPAPAIQERVRQLGAQITADYQGNDLVVLPVLKGALVFVADLLRQIELPVQVDCLSASSYGARTQSNGAPVVSPLHSDISGRHVLVVEDIVDSGMTLMRVLEQLRSGQPASLRACAFLDKPARRRAPVHADYVGFEVPDRFVVGYGLDFGERYRALPFVGVLKPERYRHPQ